jgi:hypothetical protein
MRTRVRVLLEAALLLAFQARSEAGLMFSMQEEAGDAAVLTASVSVGSRASNSGVPLRSAKRALQVEQRSRRRALSGP